QMIRIVADGAADFGPGFDLDALSKPITVTSLGAAGTETVPDSSEADYVDLRVLSTGDTYYLLDLGVPDGIDEISTLGADKTGSYGLAGFEGFIVAGSDTSSLDTDKTIDIFLSEYQNEVVVVAEGGGLSINLGSDEGSLSDVLSFRGTDTAVNIVLEPNATNNPDGDAYITFTTADGASGATGGTSEVAGADVVLGSEAGDTITGYTTIDNLLAGYGGDDTITGGSANDLLIGGSGDDTLIGGAGSDVLIDLDGNSTGYLQGGEGKDIYVVRDGAHIQGLGVADDALARGSMSTDRYNDRIAFSISTSALLAIVQLDNSIIWPPAGESEVLDYIHLRDLVSMDVSNETGDGQNWTLTASLNYNDGSPQSTVLGTATFSTDQAYQIDDTTGIGSTLKTKVLALDDFLATIHEAVLQQAMVVDQTNEDGTIVEAYGDALSLANVGQPDSISSDLHLLSDSVTLMVGLYEEDAQLVELTPGAPPILLPVIVNGQEVATRFQVGNEDEKIVGGRSGDSYEFVPSAFIDDATDEPVADQSFGLDLIVERGRRGDTSQRDKLEFAEYDDADVSDAGTGLSVHDLLAGTLSLGRDEIGSEGGGRSLLINYFSDADNDGEHDADAPLNETNVGVYKQYYEYTDSFRVEDLQLLDGSGNVAQYDLGVVDGDGNVSTADGRDAILVGSDVADTFTIIKGTAAEQLIEIIMSDFNAIDDRVQIDDEFGAIVTDEANFVTPDEGTSVISDAGPDYRVQMDNNTVDDTTDDVLLDFYFTVTVPADAEFEATVSTVTLTTA
ncbi:MAG: calcium-binding protein, partial [Gammaproteobacteria bacterium]